MFEADAVWTCQEHHLLLVNMRHFCVCSTKLSNACSLGSHPSLTGLEVSMLSAIPWITPRGVSLGHLLQQLPHLLRRRLRDIGVLGHRIRADKRDIVVSVFLEQVADNKSIRAQPQIIGDVLYELVQVRMIAHVCLLDRKPVRQIACPMRRVFSA